MKNTVGKGRKLRKRIVIYNIKEKEISFCLMKRIKQVR